MTIRMILTDLDGTLLRSDKTISERALAAIDTALDAGIMVVPATGRSVVEIGRLLPSGLRSRVICSNGAVVYDAANERVLIHRPVSPTVLSAFVTELTDLDANARFAVLTEAGWGFIAEPEYLGLMHPGDHGRRLETIQTAPLEELITHEATKIVVRSSATPLPELIAACEQAAHVGVVVTTSGVPFVEISAAGVTKATAAAWIARQAGISPQEVIAFGDSPNDLDMLQWAGRSVAMANAEPAVIDIADHIAGDNDQEGWAVVVEELLGI
ncbi:cof-like hydrolase [Propionibacterium sp. oral taxon 192 str. F0372]|uniref:Cof-type HAD-IIB family hydrolase n=1 Tax=Propionibacterium sp. oral taxon 192 TaxID=671222 RepID=UPI000352A706|nr:Cof-type HAD-IIB family hydrolase [Propionibacterium sp. oral taxon 192]EPH03230.1 cof-like hydrolase [Propionibacterium sp. oral taxon 192 str. F0372]